MVMTGSLKPRMRGDKQASVSNFMVFVYLLITLISSFLFCTNRNLTIADYDQFDTFSDDIASRLHLNRKTSKQDPTPPELGQMYK